MPEDHNDISAPSKQPPKRSRSEKQIARDKGRKRSGMNRKPRPRLREFKETGATSILVKQWAPKPKRDVYNRIAVLAAIRATGGKIDRQKLAEMLWGME